MNALPTAAQLEHTWNTDPRWAGIVRGYSADEVVRLRGTVPVEHSLAKLGAAKLWRSLHEQPFVNALGALTGNQAMQQVRAGLKAIYLSGWQVAADANVAGEMYPDQSLYPANSVPLVVKRINNTLLRADQLHHAEGNDDIDFLQPIVADAEAADLLTSDIDANDRPFCTGERTVEGFYKTRPGIDQAISRGLAYAPYADLVWCETGKPDLAFARRFAEAIHARFPGKLLAYNCSPSFNWKKNLDDDTIARFQRELGAMGYRFQFITLAGFHALNYGMFDLAHGYARRQMSAFVELQEREFAAADRGFTAVQHQREVGTGYFDAVTQAIQGGNSSTVALKGSTEEEQFRDAPAVAAA